MSTSQQIAEIRKIEQKYPADLVHNGHTYRKGYRNHSPALRKALDNLRRRTLSRKAS
jgi:hypothetical protein